ncbi:WbqC family protein [Thermodesulfobacteriota bacterium]
MIVAIHQPQYLPWIGYFDKMQKADAFCYLDNVQYKKNEWQNRNRIKTSQGWQWVTVPVQYRFPQKINEVTINNAVEWRRKHFQALISNYGKAPFFKDYIEFFEQAYLQNWEFLSDLNIYLVEYIREKLDMGNNRTVTASSLSLSDDPTERLIDICEALGGDIYLSGRDGFNYMNLKRFKDRGVKVIAQDFNHPLYPQCFGEFQTHLSVVDLLFNCGPDSKKKILASNPFLKD